MCMAPVQLVTATTSRAPRYSASRRSNRSTVAPVVGDLEHTQVATAAHVEHLAHDPGGIDVEQPVEGLAMILHEGEIPHGRAVAVHGERLLENAAGDEAGDHLLQVLVWPVVVERSHDHGRDPVGCPVR